MKRFLAPVALFCSLLISPLTSSQAAQEDAVQFMLENGYAQGYADGTFHEQDPVNRVEALKMILSYAGVQTSSTELVASFPDINSAAWYIDYLSTALEKGIIQGDDSGNFRPEAPVNRAEALKMLMLALGQNTTASDGDWFTPYMNFGIENRLILPDLAWDYQPAAPLTRGELSDILYRHARSPYTGDLEMGVASYYGWSMDGSGTASGKTLDTEAPMAAHKTLPFGTWVRITNPENMQSVDVEIVDRGPYTEGRIIDLTPSAFAELGNLGSGLLKVRLEVLK